MDVLVQHVQFLLVVVEAVLKVYQREVVLEVLEVVEQVLVQVQLEHRVQLTLVVVAVALVALVEQVVQE
tara:strand:- start:1 stop:207 length:207 start_codon:yes stop_codon:yes gene_type:complete